MAGAALRVADFVLPPTASEERISANATTSDKKALLINMAGSVEMILFAWRRKKQEQRRDAEVASDGETRFYDCGDLGGGVTLR